MNLLKKSQKYYVAQQDFIEKLRNRVSIKQAQIDRLNKRINTKREYTWWGDLLVRPIMEMVKEKFPNLTWDDDRLVPMGLRGAVSVFAHDTNGKTVAAITFTPINLNEGILGYDTGEKTADFNKGSIGYMNRLNYISKEIIDIEDLFNHVNRQANKDELLHLR